MTKSKQTPLAPVPGSAVLPGSAPLPGVATIPVVPEDYEALSGTDKQALLKVPSEQAAEVDQAMEQLWAKRSELAADLGTLAPAADDGKKRFERMKEARAVNEKAKALAAYTDDQEALANHAVMGFLNEVVGDIEHMATKKPQVATHYPLATKVVAQRRQAIADGIARAKAAKNEPKPA